MHEIQGQAETARLFAGVLSSVLLPDSTPESDRRLHLTPKSEGIPSAPASTLDASERSLPGRFLSTAARPLLSERSANSLNAKLKPDRGAGPSSSDRRSPAI